MNIGDKVSPKTVAGLWLADVPVNGQVKQQRKSVCVFNGVGTIIDFHDTIIDYDEWNSEADDDDIKYETGTVQYRNYLVSCDDGQGWAGAGALILTK